MTSNSWIVSSKETGKPILETYDPKIVDAIRADLYQIETAYEYLCRMNSEIQAGSTRYNT